MFIAKNKHGKRLILVRDCLYWSKVPLFLSIKVPHPLSLFYVVHGK